MRARRWFHGVRGLLLSMVFVLAGCGDDAGNAGGVDGGVDAGSDAVVPIEGLDPTFATEGRFVDSFTSGHDYLDCLARQSTGAVVLIGRNAFSAGEGIQALVSAVALRLTAGGSPDPTFGAGGKRITSIGRALLQHDCAVQADDKVIVIGGVVTMDRQAADALLLRYTADGALDPSFGGDGIVTEPGWQVQAVVAQPEDKIVVAGTRQGALTLVRYLPDGSRDPAFGSDGAVAIASPSFTQAFDLIVQSDGALVAVGTAVSAPSSSELVVARLSPAGALDLGFGAGGVVRHPGAEAQSVDIDGSGRILVRTPTGEVVRFTATGALDATFGTAGVASTGGIGVGLVVDPDGSFVVDVTRNLLAGFDASGAPDPTFGNGGSLSLYTTYLTIGALARDPSGALWVGASGGLTAFGASTIEVHRLSAGGQDDASFQPGLAGAGATRETLRAVVLEPDGSLVGIGFFKDFWRRAFLARWTKDGVLDTSFGASATGYVEDAPLESQLAGFSRMSNGTLVAAVKGSSSFSAIGWDASGVRASSFGDEDGEVEVTIGTGSQGALASAADVADRLVLAGYIGPEVGMVRLDASGALDPSFGTAGAVTTALPTAGGQIHGIAIGADGSIVAAALDGQERRPFVLRYSADGVLDPSFGAAGVVQLDQTNVRSATVLAGTDGSVTVVGTAMDFDKDRAFAVRLSADGTLDAGFAGGGVLELEVPAHAIVPAALRDDHLLLGVPVSDGELGSDMLIRDYTASGTLDPSFGDGGQLRIALSAGNDAPGGITVQPDGKAVVAGHTWTADHGADLVLLRLQ